MKKKLSKLFLLCSMIFIFSRCDFISDTLTFKNNSKAFINDLLARDYNDCLNFVMYKKDQNKDSLNMLFDHLRTAIVENFGEKPEMTFMQSSRTFDIVGGSDVRNDTMVLDMQISNGTKFGVLKFSYLLENKKIVDFHVRKYYVPAPNLTLWWILLFVALCIPLFNIYMIVKVKRSNLKQKWLYYIIIIVINVTSIGYHAIGGFFFQLKSLEMLAGFGFSKEGFVNTYVSVGIPLGALFTLWQLKRKRLSLQEEVQPDDIEDIPEEEYTA